MALDSHADADVPVAIPVVGRRMGPVEFYRKMQRNILELVPAEAYHEPILSGGRWVRWHMVTDPSLLEHILKHREDIYPRSDLTRRILRPTRGENVFVAYGESWRRQHNAMVPVFQHRGVLNVAPLMTGCADDCARRLAARSPGIVDAYAEMIAVTCDIICDAAMSGREQLDRGHLAQAVGRYLASISRISALDLVGAPNWVPRPARLLDRHGPRMEAMMEAIITGRVKRGPSSPPDVLDMLIAAQDPETGARLGALELRNNLLAFIIAGHETTALALTWALYLLAFDREVQTRARAVARDVLGGRPASAEDVPRLGYVRQILEEAMRLYPPVALSTRTARGHDELAGRPVKPGQMIILPVYALHRHRGLWEQPDRFNPDRFAPELAKSRHRYSYLPFGAGPRICIGMSFAMMEMVIVLSTLLARLDFALVDGVVPRPEMLLTLRPANGLPLRLTPL